MTGSRGALRDIPQTDVLLARAEGREEFARVARPLLLEAVRAVVDGFRAGVLDGRAAGANAAEFFGGDAFLSAVDTVVRRLLDRRHVEVVNATGIVLHTGLGRAPLGAEARDAAAGAARYAVVEVDPDSGERDLRESRNAALLCDLTGAEAATVVNNNAAAVMLALAALAHGREVVVARGELVEIGGGFRMPDVMKAAGVSLKEVGATNRCYVADHAAAIGEATGLLLKVHPSNFRIVGFTASPTVAELAALAAERHVPFVYDLGSGLLDDVDLEPLKDEPTVRAALAAGADLVLFSGDKLLGGPQAGLIVGRRQLVLRLRRHPLYRAVRPGKLDLAALEATLLAHRQAQGGIPQLPLYRTLATPIDALRARASALAAALAGVAGATAQVVATTGFLGSGAAPARPFEGVAVALRHAALSADALAERLRRGAPRVFARIEDGAVLLELRTVFEDQLDALAAAARRALS